MSSVTTYRPAGPVSPRSWRRSVTALLTVLASCALVAAALMLVKYGSDRVLLPVKQVRVDGELQRVSREQLQQVVTSHLAPGLLQIDMDGLRSALESLAWVESANVRRVLPDSLLVGVVEHVPVARWGKTELLGRDGTVFEAAERMAEFDHLPSLLGPLYRQRELHATYMQYADWFTALGLQIATLELDPRRSWRVWLHDDVLLELGRGELSARLQRFEQLFAGPLGGEWDNVQSVDLRYSNGVAVRWRDRMQHTVAVAGRE